MDHRTASGLACSLCLCLVGVLSASHASQVDNTGPLNDLGWDRADHFFSPTVAISSNRRHMALAGSRGLDGRLHIWDLATGKRTLILKGFPRVTVAAFTPDGEFLMTGHNPGLLTIWNVATGAIVRQLQFPREAWIRSLVFSNDGARLALGGQSGTLYLLTYPDFEESWRTHAHHYGLSDIAFTRDDSVIHTVADDQHIYLWNSRTGQPNDPIRELRRDGGRLKGHTGMIKTFALVDNDTKALSGSYWEGGNVKSYASVAPPDEILRLWDPRSGRVLESFRLNWGIRCCIQQLARPPRVAFINTAGWAELDGAEALTLQVLDVDTRKIVQSLTDTSPLDDPYLHGVQHFRVVPDANVVVVGLRSGRFLLWDLRSNKVIAYFISPDDFWAVVQPDSRFDVSNIRRLDSEPGLAFLKAGQYRHSPGLLHRLLANEGAGK